MGPDQHRSGHGKLQLPRRLVAYMFLLSACYSREPAREATPTPAAPKPEALEAPAEEKADAPAKDRDDAVESSGAAAPPPPSVAPAPTDNARPAAPRSEQRPASKARSRAAETTRAQRRGAAEGETDLQGPSSAEHLMQRLGSAVNLGTPNCPAARSRKQAICDLAQQICQLVDRDPNVASVTAYCEDARRRCTEAGQRVTERCP